MDSSESLGQALTQAVPDGFRGRKHPLDLLDLRTARVERGCCVLENCADIEDDNALQIV
jgi:hypothetical protein